MIDKIHIAMPQNVKKIIEKLNAAGFEAYAVGGCIRDALLQRNPADWDITTSATPIQVKSLFQKTIDTGIAHGTVTVMMADREGYEVTTYRIDGKYEDARHPKEVWFTRSLKEDLMRRDFTMNAMAYNDKEGLIDLYGGHDDMLKKEIRCVGNPEERFSEDALRMMRAVRFSAQLGFSIEDKTAKAIKAQVVALKKISAERIRVELEKLLVSNHPDYIKKAYELGITSVVLPEFDACMKQKQNNRYHIYNVGDHTIKTLLAVEPDRILRFTMLFHDFGKPRSVVIKEDGITHFYGHAVISAKMAEEVMKRLKFDNETLRKVKLLVENHDLRIQANSRQVRKVIARIGMDMFPYYVSVLRADTLGKSPKIHKERLEELTRILDIFEEVKENDECVSIKDLRITGEEVMKIGIPQGKIVGEILNQLLEEVINDPQRNNEKYLLEETQILYAKIKNK